MQKYLLATRDDLLAKRNSSAIFADDGCAYREPTPAPAHLDVRDPFVLVHAHCDPAAIHRDMVRRKQMVLAHVATSVDSMLSTRPVPKQQQQQHASESAASPTTSTDSSVSSTASSSSSSTQRQPPHHHHQHHELAGPTGMAWDAADSVRFLTEKRLNAEPVGALPILSVKDEERAKKRANDEWRLRRKVESEQKLAARVQADEAAVRRKTEFAAASKFEQQQRYISTIYDIQHAEYHAAIRGTGRAHGECYQIPTQSMIKTPCEHTRAHRRAAEEKLALRQSVVPKGPFSGIRPDCMHTATAIAEPATVAAYYQARSAASYAKHADPRLLGIDRELRLSKAPPAQAQAHATSAETGGTASGTQQQTYAADDRHLPQLGPSSSSSAAIKSPPRFAASLSSPSLLSSSSSSSSTATHPHQRHANTDLNHGLWVAPQSSSTIGTELGVASPTSFGQPPGFRVKNWASPPAAGQRSKQPSPTNNNSTTTTMASSTAAQFSKSLPPQSPPPVFLAPLSPSAPASSNTPKAASISNASHSVAATAAQLRQAPPNFFPFSSNPFVVRYQTAMSVPDAVPESLALAPDAGVFRRSMP